MNQHRLDRRRCYVHPTELVVGICALCLNERLLVLASKQAHLNPSPRKSPIPIPNIFALTTLLNRLDIKPHKANDDHGMYVDSSSSSLEDSFISIKFEENGVASWEKEEAKRAHDLLQCDMAKNVKGVVEHAKPHATLRWRRRIGHLFQVARWKKSSKANLCHADTAKLKNMVGWGELFQREESPKIKRALKFEQKKQTS